MRCSAIAVLLAALFACEGEFVQPIIVSASAQADPERSSETMPGSVVTANAMVMGEQPQHSTDTLDFSPPT